MLHLGALPNLTCSKHMLRPPHNIFRLNNKTYLQTPCANSTGISRSRTKKIWSTQKPLTLEPTIHHADHELAPVNEPCSNIICSMLTSESIWSYSDQTGKFPRKSSRRILYIFILYHYHTNTIHATLIPNRQAVTIDNAWQSTYKTLGYPRQHHILDNEYSPELKAAFAKHKIDY